jgi:hypothetical protein
MVASKGPNGPPIGLFKGPAGPRSENLVRTLPLINALRQGAHRAPDTRKLGAHRPPNALARGAHVSA